MQGRLLFYGLHINLYRPHFLDHVLRLDNVKEKNEKDGATAFCLFTNCLSSNITKYLPSPSTLVHLQSLACALNLKFNFPTSSRLLSFFLTLFKQL